jgi:hypothetical protein
MKNSPASNLRRTQRARAKRKAGQGRPCAIEGCPYGHYARGYCERHWEKARRTKGAWR